MLKNSAEVFHIASLRVLKTLQFLFAREHTMEELIEKLAGIGREECDYFIVSKYINTCKFCGLDIQKLGGKYMLINLPFGMRFSAKESKLIYEIKQCCDKLKSSKLSKFIENFIKRLHLPFYKSDNGLLSSPNYKTIKSFERACKTNSRIQLSYYGGSHCICTPYDIKVVDGRVVLYVMDHHEIIEVDPSSVSSIIFVVKNPSEKVKKDNENLTFDNSAVFELYGAMAGGYQLRENEQMINFGTDRAVILCKYEDKETLLRRLMRYDTSCKLLKPNSYVTEFKKMIDDTLKNYEQDNG